MNNQLKGIVTKDLLIRDEDVQVLQDFENVQAVNAYLKTELFNKNGVKELSTLLDKAPKIKIYTVA